MRKSAAAAVLTTFFIGVGSLLGACKLDNNGKGSRGNEPATDPKTPVARVGSAVITAGELETAARPQLARIETQMAEPRSGGPNAGGGRSE